VERKMDYNTLHSAQLDEFMARPGRDAQFVHASCVVRPSPLGGNGMFARDAIPAGTLLLLERPFYAPALPFPKVPGCYELMERLPLARHARLMRSMPEEETMRRFPGLRPDATVEESAARRLEIALYCASKPSIEGLTGRSALEMDRFLRHRGWFISDFIFGSTDAFSEGCRRMYFYDAEAANMFSIFPETSIVDGGIRGMYVSGSLFNHSCRPNAEFYWTRDLTLVVFAARDIAPEEEIRIDYFRGSYEYDPDSISSRIFPGRRCKCGECMPYSWAETASVAAVMKNPRARLANVVAQSRRVFVRCVDWIANPTAPSWRDRMRDAGSVRALLCALERVSPGRWLRMLTWLAGEGLAPPDHLARAPRQALLFRIDCMIIHGELPRARMISDAIKEL